MNNNELLLAISDMMDQKLDVINVRMDTMENKLDAKIDSVENKLSAEINAVENKLEAELNALDDRLSGEIKKINLTLENIVIPRISHIEQCYLDTSERYIIETGRINGLTTDVQVLKSVVQDHSRQLQKIS